MKLFFLIVTMTFMYRPTSMSTKGTVTVIIIPDATMTGGCDDDDGDFHYFPRCCFCTILGEPVLLSEKGVVFAFMLVLVEG
jgi:hypothetical protein